MIALEMVGECAIEAEIIPIPLETYLHQTFFQSLCQACLQEIQHLTLLSDDEDEFYFEGNLIVFTAHYHFKRGYCCRSKCKHCTYGYAKVEG
jgi:hypothetical protein